MTRKQNNEPKLWLGENQRRERDLINSEQTKVKRALRERIVWWILLALVTTVSFTLTILLWQVT